MAIAAGFAQGLFTTSCNSTALVWVYNLINGLAVWMSILQINIFLNTATLLLFYCYLWLLQATIAERSLVYKVYNIFYLILNRKTFLTAVLDHGCPAPFGS